jgi:predicted transcriptional regulator
MKLRELIKRAGLEIVAGETGLDKEVSSGYTSDLLSDVMGNSCEGQIWITMQTHMNVIAVASLKDHAAVITVSGNRPAIEVVEKAAAEGVTLLATLDDAFTISGKIYMILREII